MTKQVNLDHLCMKWLLETSNQNVREGYDSNTNLLG